MFQKILGGWKEEGNTDDAASIPATHSSGAVDARRIAPTASTHSEAASSPVVAMTTTSLLDGDDANNAIDDDTLVQFPAYGTRSQAQNSNLNPTADWLLGGTASIPSQQQLMLKQQKQQQQQQAEEEKEDEKPLNSKGASPSPEQRPINRDWDDDEQILWRETIIRAARSNAFGSTRSEDPISTLVTTATLSSSHKTATAAPRTTLTAPELKDPVKDWIYAYYYHTGVTPKIEMTRPHPLFDRTGPTTTTNALRKSLPRSAFSGHNEAAGVTANGSSPLFSMSMIRERTDKEDSKEIETDDEHDKSGDGGHGGVDDDDDDEYEGVVPHRQQPAPLDPSSINNNNQIVGSTTAMTPKVAPEDRQHWMPDRLCKHCYACDTPFTVFRRRHHCRICGQVFCNNCSGFFVPAQPDSSGSAINNNNNTGNSSSTPIIPNSSHNTNNNASTSTHLTTSTNVTNTNKTILRACKMCYEQVTERRQLLEEEEDYAGRKRRKNAQDSANPAVATTPSGITSISSPAQHQPLTQATTAANSPGGPGVSSPTLQEELDRGDSSVLHSLSKKRTESAYARRSLLSQQQALERDEKEQASKLLHTQSELEKQEIQLEKEASSHNLVVAQNNGNPDRAFHKRLVRVTSTESLSAGLVDHSKAAVDEGNRHLDLISSSHLEQMGKALLSTDAPRLFPELSQQTDQPNKLYEQWVSKLMALATRCCATVEPSVKKGDFLDIRPYVKIKGMSVVDL
jgi:hypothetical protein